MEHNSRSSSRRCGDERVSRTCTEKNKVGAVRGCAEFLNARLITGPGTGKRCLTTDGVVLCCGMGSGSSALSVSPDREQYSFSLRIPL